MPITRGDLTEPKSPRGRRAEYTRKCGWIDWAHATPDRNDLKMIWAALGDRPLREDGSLDMSKIAIVRGNDGSAHHYIRVPFQLEISLKTRIGSGFPDYNFTGYVKIHPQHNRAYYQQAALSLYLWACGQVESHQGSWVLEWKASSSFAMEDMISNLMAFWQHTYSLKADTVMEMAGGWVDRTESLKMSTLVFDAMEKKGVAQPKSSFKEWYKAHLFNDVADIDDKRGGWHIIPEAFQLMKPIPFHQDDPPGSTIGIDWDTDAVLPTPGAGSRASSYLPHLRGHFETTGLPGQGMGRRPGPLGLA